MINQYIKRVYGKLNVYERNIFGCFYDIHKDYRRENFGILKERFLCIGAYIFCKWQRYFRKDIYFKYLEVPITTKCSLNCKECNNLIQYYQNPQNYEIKKVINDIKRICSVSKQIKKLRILGGEPLVHPELSVILEELKKIDKIKHIEIVTNGTLLFNNKCMSLLKSPKFSVDISNYGEHSRMYTELIRQLDRRNIRYYTQGKQKDWKAISSCRCRERSTKELQEIFSVCTEDCHSLLDGELHICARSSHGMDLGLIEKCKEDYVCVRKACGRKELKEQIYTLLNSKQIRACNYCDMFQFDKMETIPSAEQISKKAANDRMMQWKK